MAMKFKIQTAIFVALFLLLPSPVLAGEVYDQDVADGSYYRTAWAGSGPFVVQQLGIGLTGIVTDITVYLHASSSQVWTTVIYHCDNLVVNSGLCTNYVQDTNSAGQSFATDGTARFYTESVENQIDGSDSISLDPTKYYYLALTPYGTAGDGRIYGSLADTFSGGAAYCVGDACGVGGTSMTIADIFFDLGGTQTYGDSNSVYITWPKDLMVATSTSVPVNFTYTKLTNINGYKVFMEDMTVGSRTELTGSLTSSSGTVSKQYSLFNNHAYKVSVYLTDDGVITTNIGGERAARFFLGTSSVKTILPVYNSTGGGTITYDTSGNLIGTSSSITTSTIIPTMLDNILRNKFPFSYVYDGFVLIRELFTGTSGGSNPNWSYSNGSASTTVKIFDSSTIASIPAVDTMKTVMGYALYTMTGVYLMSSIMSAI